MIWSIQTLRFVAAAMVVYVHSAQTAYEVTGSAGLMPLPIAGLGLTGVDIFFVISGVVITRTAPGMTPLDFAWRRIRRIVPFYYLCCIPALLIAAKSGIGWREMLATFAFWPATDVMTKPVISVAWTLCFEMLFYACAMLALIDRRIGYALLAVFAAALAFRSPDRPALQFVGNPLILEFLFGAAIALAPSLRPAVWLLPIGAACILLVGISGLAPTGEAVDFLRGENNLQRAILIGIPAAMVVYGTMQIETKQSVWAYLGDASYAIYLAHPFVVSLLEQIWMKALPLPPDAIVLITFGLAVLFCWRIHEMVERPILKTLPVRLA